MGPAQGRSRRVTSMRSTATDLHECRSRETSVYLPQSEGRRKREVHRRQINHVGLNHSAETVDIGDLNPQATLTGQIINGCPRRWQTKAWSSQSGGPFFGFGSLTWADLHRIACLCRHGARSPSWQAQSPPHQHCCRHTLACHGGARPCGNAVLTTAGTCLAPASVCTPRKTGST